MGGGGGSFAYAYKSYPPILDPLILVLTSSRGVSMRGGENLCNVYVLVIFAYSHGGDHGLLV